MTRVISLVPVLAFLAAANCGRREAAPRPQEPGPAAAAPAAAHTTPHAEDDLHLTADTRRDLRITTAAVEAVTRADQMSEIPGEIRADERAYAEVGSPVQGRVAALRAEPGQRVRAGQALVDIRSTEVGRARAEFATATAKRTLARQVVARARSLVQERIAPARDLEQAEADLAAAEADVEAADTMLRALGVSPTAPAGSDVASIGLTSPIAGVVLDREATLGQVVDPSATLFRIADLSRVWLVIQASERDALRIRTGSDVLVRLPALPGVSRPGVVTWIGQRVRSDSHTLPVRIELANPDGELRPGMTATALVPLAAPSGHVLTVPAAALQRLGDAWVAFVTHEDDDWHFEIRTVGRGRDLGASVEVVKGLAAGERVVVEGSFVLKAEAEKARGGARPAHTH